MTLSVGQRDPTHSSLPRSSADNLSSRNHSVSAIPLGEPGFAFRYDRTFGEVDKPYFEDTSHLNHPIGLTSDGNNIWIAEMDGMRALKYSNTGLFLTQIGVAGLPDVYPTTIRSVADVSVDGAGNVWVVDFKASHILKFRPDLGYEKDLGMVWNGG